METTKNIPEIVAGVPTAKSRTKERRCLIQFLYKEHCKILQKKNGGCYGYNKFLGNIPIYVKQGESDKKTIFEASKNWKSTVAVEYLIETLENAVALENTPIYSQVKGGTQKKNGYCNMAVLYYTKQFPKEDPLYKYFREGKLNIKLTIGIKNNGKHIQYSINKIEI